MKIRWIDTSCFEIVTDENEVIVTDPYIDACENHPVDASDVQKMDYILITHTHFDHITELDRYFEEYRPKILASTHSAIELVKAFDLSGQCTYGMDHLQKLDFGNTRITRIAGRHSIPGRKERHLARESQILWNSLEQPYADLMVTGYMDFSNFYIETKNNTRILFWGGSVSRDQIEEAKAFHPDIVLMQIPSNPYDEIVDFIRATGASYVLPHHHDTYYKTKDVPEMMRELGEKIEKTCTSTRFLDPVPGKWYSFRTILEPE